MFYSPLVRGLVLLCALFSPALPAADHLTLGVHPFLTAKELVPKFTPLINYLGEELGKPVRLVIAKDYAEHIRRVGEDKLDLAYLGPASYVEMVEQYGSKPLLARQEIQGKPTFRGALILPAQSGINSLQDLKGKRFAFGSPHSTMSHLVPRYLLLEAGLGGEDFSFNFLGNHEDVALGVLMGEFDAGAVKEAVYHKYRPQGMKLLTWTPAISEHLFVAGNHLPEAEVKAVRAALLALSAEKVVARVLAPLKSTLTGLVAVEDRDYQNLRQILRTLKQHGIPE